MPRGGVPADQGLFGPSSVTWRVLGDPVMVVGGLRALLVQALHPLAMAGVDQHSDYRVDPWGRLQRTAEYVLTATFSDIALAEAAGAAVQAMHARVRGTDPHTGLAYSANDPELQAWVHNVLVHSYVAAYRRYGGRLDDTDADRFVAEQTRMTALVGLDPAAVPDDLAGLRSYLRAAPLDLSPAARAGAKVLLAPPMPGPLRPLWAIPATAAIAVLPARVRTAYGLGWFPPADLAVRPAVFTLLRAMNLVLPGPELAYSRQRR